MNSSQPRHVCTLTTDSALEVLVKLYDHDFIAEYLSQMIFHHLEGIRMSQKMLNMSRNQNVIREAQMLIQSQSRQVEQMRQWLAQWYNMQPNERSRQLIESDACLIKHLNENMDDQLYIIETIQHHHMAHVMSLLLLERITPERFPDLRNETQYVRQLAHNIITEQLGQIQRFFQICTHNDHTDKEPYWASHLDK